MADVISIYHRSVRYTFCASHFITKFCLMKILIPFSGTCSSSSTCANLCNFLYSNIVLHLWVTPNQSVEIITWKAHIWESSVSQVVSSQGCKIVKMTTRPRDGQIKRNNFWIVHLPCTITHSPWQVGEGKFYSPGSAI